MSVSWKKYSPVFDLSKYRLITIFWNSLPIIFKNNKSLDMTLLAKRF